MKPFWHTQQQPPYIGIIRKQETQINWAVIFATAAVLLTLMLLGLGLFADDVVEFFGKHL